MKILIDGAGGLLGKKCAEIGQKYFDIIGTYHHNPPKKNYKTYQLDITKKEDVNKLIKKINPDAIIHAAALTNVDECEKNQKKARKINFEGTKYMAKAAEEINSKFIYVSTDYVFDGKKGLYKEDDETNPINYYGRSKLLGEKAVKNICSNYAIARTSVLYGWNPDKPNFVTWVMGELKNKKQIKIINDNYNTPTLVDNLAEMIYGLIKEDKKGIYHTSGSERINRYDFTLKIADVFDLDKNLINPITSDKMNWVAERPKDSSLNTKKISKIIKPLNIKEGLEKMWGKK